MKMRFSVSAVLVTALNVVAADKTCKQLPTGQNVGNPISAPGLNQIVPAGVSFTITWAPTNKNDRVSLLLLRGPSTNILPDGCIKNNIPNTGTYVWTPPTSLEPDVTHYGLQIIVEGSGDYQYSTQFGISNPAYGQTTTTSHTHTKARHTKTATGYGPAQTPEKKQPHPHVRPAVSQLPDGQPQVKNATHTHSIVVSTLSLNATSLPPVPSATVAPPPHNHNHTHVHLTVPASLKTHTKTKSAHQSTATSVDLVNGTRASTIPATTAPTTSAPAKATGGASHLGAAGFVAGLGALAAFVL